MSDERIKRLARIAADCFERARRNTNDERTTYTRIKEDAAAHDELRDLVYECHCGSMPDDWTFEAFARVLECIAEDGEDAQIEPDIYTHELLKWLKECPNATDACDRAVEEYGALRESGIVAVITLGQAFMLDEIRVGCLAYLQGIADDEESALVEKVGLEEVY